MAENEVSCGDDQVDKGKEKFNLQTLYDCFSSCLRDNQELGMDSYILGYNELYKFFHLLGTVFGFVASDVKSKMLILEEYRKGKNGEQFITIDRMINYEKENDLLKKKDYISGSRTLLRLHRALEFISEFLDRVTKLEENERTHRACQESYNATLAKFHPWLIQKGALMAMYTLPNREGLLRQVSHSSTSDNGVLELLPKVVDVIRKVHMQTEKLYKDYEILNLP